MRLFFKIDPTKFKKIEVMQANGMFTIEDQRGIVYAHEASSGGWGNGAMPCGFYKLTGYGNTTEPPYTLFSVGWYVNLEPQFSTTRTNLLIHPDGNVPGSLGCLVLPFKSLDENIKCRNLLRDIIENGTTYLTVMQLSLPQGGVKL